MMKYPNIVYLITSYINTHKNKLFSPVIVSYNSRGNIVYTSIYFCFQGTDIDIMVYNDNFIKIKVDEQSILCDSLKTVREEIDRLNSVRF